MRQPIYKMPPSKPLVNINNLDENIENIIDKKLKDIYSRLGKLEEITESHDKLWDMIAKSFSNIPIPGENPSTKIIMRKDLEKEK